MVGAFALMVAGSLLLFAACQGASTQPSIPTTDIPEAIPTIPPSLITSPKSAAQPTLTPVPIASSLPSTTAPITTPTSTLADSPTPTSRPIPTPTASLMPTPTLAPTPTLTLIPTPTIQQPGQNSVFYSQNGLTLEYYWPLDGGLSGDETEILGYNESESSIEFTTTDVTFTESGNVRTKISGTWEKFPSRASWERIEYISIPPSPYQGQSLLAQPGEKAKIHWHLDRITSTETNQSATLDLTVRTGHGTETIKMTLLRESEENNNVVVAAPEPTQEPHEIQQSPNSEDHADTVSTDPVANVWWSFNGTTWLPSGPPPVCPEPFVVQTPIDIGTVTSALWPGQQRGAYVADGGFRFDANSDSDVTVRAPVGSHLVQASRYLEGDDEQILLFFSVPCGFFYRFDHVRVASPKLADVLKVLPTPTSGDSRTTFINPPLWIEQGEIVATSVGIIPSNIFVDFGLYDVRAPNNMIPNPAWADLFTAGKEFAHYGVCFFDYLPGDDGETMRSLPTGKEGKTSEYCK